MGKLRSSLRLVSSFLLLSVAATGDRGQSGPGAPGRWPLDHPRIERLLDLLDSDQARTYLGLEGPQLERLRQIALEAEKASVQTRAEMQVREIELREALRAEKTDREEILKKVQEITDLGGQMMRRNVEAILAAKALLSPEQRRKMLLLLESGFGGGPPARTGRSTRARPGTSPSPESQPIPIHPGEPPVQ